MPLQPLFIPYCKKTYTIENKGLIDVGVICACTDGDEIIILFWECINKENSMNIKMLKAAVAGLVLSVSGYANAGIILINDEAIFQNAGIANIVSDFEEFGTSEFSEPSDPYLQGGISYSSADNLVLGGSNSIYDTNGTNMLTNNFWNPIEGTFYQNFSLFGFDAGWSNSDDNGSRITIGTNIDTYVFDVDFDVASSSAFYGFIASDDEFFISFEITSNVYNALVSIDNVTVGTSAIPEPSTLAIFALAIMGLAPRRFKKQ